MSREGDVFCFEAVSGNVIWSLNLVDTFELRIPGWGFGASPLVVGDMLLLNAGGAGLALQKQTGKVIWQSNDGEAGYNVPVVFEFGGKDVAVFASSKYYQGVELQSGKLLLLLLLRVTKPIHCVFCEKNGPSRVGRMQQRLDSS